MSDQKKSNEASGQSLAQPAEKARNKRNLAMALMITGFVVLVYAVTILRLGASVADRSF